MSEPTTIICRFYFTCSEDWHGMEEVPDAHGARHCARCKKLVHPCYSYRMLQEHVAAGHCVAINLHTQYPLLGAVAPPPKIPMAR